MFISSRVFSFSLTTVRLEHAPWENLDGSSCFGVFFGLQVCVVFLCYSDRSRRCSTHPVTVANKTNVYRESLLKIYNIYMYIYDTYIYIYTLYNTHGGDWNPGWGIYPSHSFVFNMFCFLKRFMFQKHSTALFCSETRLPN